MVGAHLLIVVVGRERKTTASDLSCWWKEFGLISPTVCVCVCTSGEVHMAELSAFTPVIVVGTTIALHRLSLIHI